MDKAVDPMVRQGPDVREGSGPLENEDACLATISFSCG